MEVNLSNGRVDDKENLTNDISNAFKQSMFSDITFDMADNVSISTNKFMLACRVPYFSTMLYGGLADNMIGKSVPLQCCNSSTFREILKFVWKGEIILSDMKMQSLLDLLEISRFFCIERLVEVIIDYMEQLLGSGRVDFEDCLIGYEFTVQNKFSRASDLFLEFINKNVLSMYDLEEFGNMSESSMEKFLSNKGASCTEIERFRAVAKWFERKDVSKEIEKKICGFFDWVTKFDHSELKEVRMSKVFGDKDICDILEEKLIHISRERQHLIEEGEANGVVKFSLSEGNALTSVGYESRAQFTVPLEFQIHFINNIQFNLGSIGGDHQYCYTLECSKDGENWTEIIRVGWVIEGQQSVCFERS